VSGAQWLLLLLAAAARRGALRARGVINIDVCRHFYGNKSNNEVMGERIRMKKWTAITRARHSFPLARIRFTTLDIFRFRPDTPVPFTLHSFAPAAPNYLGIPHNPKDLACQIDWYKKNDKKRLFFRIYSDDYLSSPRFGPNLFLKINILYIARVNADREI